ncbi:MAG: T9SS type A sorting domain-containing protein, partial [Bacteroidales bacterium]|nr:T9SS type A sorting domain-containing protein [Bacteroidales bacterium]
WTHDTHEYGGGGWVYQVNCSYDYNDDGITDVLAATGNDGGNTGPRRVYCLNGLTGESIWECFTSGAVFSTIGIEDFTGDGKPDVLAGATDSYQTQGKVYGINGDNGNIEWTFLTEGTSVWALMQLNDITGKGVKDIAAGDFGGNFYFINPENGSQIHNGSISTVIILRFAKLDDVNNDGHPDILVAHSGTNGIVLSGFDGSTIWFWSLADKSWNVARIGDITGDNINDVIIGTLYSSNYCYFRNRVDGEELESINYSTPVDAINSIPDIVGDGSMEMVAGGRDGKVYCYSGGLDAYVNIDENMISENIFEQLKNYPNPFTNETKILFELSEESYVILSVYNIHGEKICVLIDEIIPAGTHTVTWNGKSQSGQLLQSGIYFYELKTDFGTFRKKMSLVR